MNTKSWFNACVPNPDEDKTCVQVGCHIEEFAEMLEALGWKNHAKKMHDMADIYKARMLVAKESIRDCDKLALLDAVIDQNVTGQGICHMMGMNHDGALQEVERSNASKLEEGRPVFDANGKIKKGKHYSKPDLKPYL